MDGEISFAGYYSQFLDDKTEAEMFSQISLEELKKSKDEHLNDIPMRKWDAISGIVFRGSEMIQGPRIRKEFADRIQLAQEGISAATLVCIYKQQARKTLNDRKTQTTN